MKRILPLLSLLITLAASGQAGYEIRINFKPFKNQYIYLGHYFGKTYPIIDSARLNDKGEAVFKGSQPLPGGIYLVGYPDKQGFFEILIDREQHFSVLADTATLAKGPRFVNSPDNDMFVKYQQYMGGKGKTITSLQQQLKNHSGPADSVKITNQLIQIDSEVKNHREELITKHPGTILTALLMCMREPELTGKMKNPANREDSLQAYLYFKSHFWDGVSFWDGRLAYTTFFEEKLDKYFTQLVVPQPDSVIKEIDNMMSYAVINPEMTRFLLVKFVNRYLNQKYMWEDAVYVHLFEKYFANKDYPWLNDKSRKIITDRAYSLMANIMGTPASDVELPDTAGRMTSLYGVPAEYMVVAFWDPTCGHCREVLPKLDSFYLAKWKAAGLKIFAVAKETDGTKKDWMNFITEKNLQDWVHVYYSKADDKARIDSGIPGYSQLFDIQSFPTLYLLDKEKRIVAKKLSYQQIDEVLQLKMKGQ